jgi:hypothetical protein
MASAEYCIHVEAREITPVKIREEVPLEKMPGVVLDLERAGVSVAHQHDPALPTAEPAGSVPGASREDSDASRLNGELIRIWMQEEGWTNPTLAAKLRVSERALSSIRNNGDYHGSDAVNNWPI